LAFPITYMVLIFRKAITPSLYPSQSRQTATGDGQPTHRTPALMATSAPSLSRLLMVIAQMIFHGRRARTMSITPEKTECHGQCLWSPSMRQACRGRVTRTSNSGIVVSNKVGRETRARHVIVPSLLHRPALDPMNDTVGAQDQVGGNNDEPEKVPHPAARDAQ
jgi:hypothetical protein